jgi:hypothetical protein
MGECNNGFFLGCILIFSLITLIKEIYSFILPLLSSIDGSWGVGNQVVLVINGTSATFNGQQPGTIDTSAKKIKQGATDSGTPYSYDSTKDTLTIIPGDKPSTTLTRIKI